jgi:hypothetical protein
VDLTKLGGHILVTEGASSPKLETTPHNFVNLLIFSSYDICDIRCTKLIHLDILHFGSLMDYEPFESKPRVISSAILTGGRLFSLEF